MAIFTEEFVQQKKQQYKDCSFILKVLDQLLQIKDKVNFSPFYPIHIFGSCDNAIDELHLSINQYTRMRIFKGSDECEPGGIHFSCFLHILVCIKNVITLMFVSAFDKDETFNETSEFTDPKNLKEISKLECPIDRGLAFINYVFKTEIIEDSEENEKYFLNHILPQALEGWKCKSSVSNEHRKEEMRFEIRRNKLSRSKSINKDFKNSFHSINRPKEI